MSVRVAEPASRDLLLQQLRARTQSRIQHLVDIHPALAGLLPDGGLRPGCAYQVSGGALLLALLAEPSASGSWCSVVGIPEFGAEAARSAGVALERLALVPRPGERWLSVVAALAEVMGIVAVRPSGRVSPADANRLAARLRERGCVLLACGEWPRAEASLWLGQARWTGLGEGHGYLSGREVDVSARTRHGLTRTARLVLPGRHGQPAENAADLHLT
ncbi:MAG: hypothetical protein KIT69_21595, partial [Propionibacteriaceae bacterium]|nr:hypothetical protein [Propionibacteriaceae bacterium]